MNSNEGLQPSEIQGVLGEIENEGGSSDENFCAIHQVQNLMNPEVAESQNSIKLLMMYRLTSNPLLHHKKCTRQDNLLYMTIRILSNVTHMFPIPKASQCTHVTINGLLVWKAISPLLVNNWTFMKPNSSYPDEP